MKIKRPPILLTFIVWLAIVFVAASWRLVYAWHFGNLLKFVAEDWPLLVLILLVMVVCELFYFRDK
jgi:hypothetical protein